MMLLPALLACSSLRDSTFGRLPCPPWSLDSTPGRTAVVPVLEEPDGGVVVLGGPGIAPGDLDADGDLDLHVRPVAAEVTPTVSERELAGVLDSLHLREPGSFVAT